ncbi:MAG: CBS domain-containing protein [Candidatus Lokiarchaeota archaeon]|nr:CBS domain-containing protein [Candidatus Lokiarchaeota archaeon]MBD3339007.1 CBS domain-containing protein [Candidatus Lokiarchaeota archaeon]
MTDYYRKKAFTDEFITTFDDVLILPGYTNFKPSEVDTSTTLGKYFFNIPIISAAMDTVTEQEMAIKMALLGGLGVLHRNCSYEKQLKMVRAVKRARSFVIDDVATIGPNEPIFKAKYMMENYGISGLVVIGDNNKVCGIFTKRDLPYLEEELKEKQVKDFMTQDVISIKPNASRNDALRVLFEHRKEKLPIIDDDGTLKGLITKKDLKPEFPLASKDEEGRLLCALALSPKFPKSPQAQSMLKEIDKYTDIFFIDVAEYYKIDDIQGTKKLMDFLEADFVVGNIGTYEAAEHILTECDFSDEKLIGIKVGMGSGSICTTSIQTGVGAPTMFATAQVADAIKDYNPKVKLIADGGFKNPGDLPKAFSVGADMIMTGHFFAGCTESPGYVDTIQGRKVKIYRGMGSKEARAANFILDRYSLESKSLPEGVSDYVPFVGDLSGVILALNEGLKNGMIYVGAKNLSSLKKAKIGMVSAVGQSEQKPHDLLGKF